MKKEQQSIMFKYVSTYVDIDTGAVLRYKDATNKNKYIIIKTTRHVEYKTENKCSGTVHYTRECRKQPQGKLF